MKGLDTPWYLTAWIISNFVSVLILLAAFRSARLARLLFFLLFSWACWMNWTTALHSPEAYQEYASLSFFAAYKDFITGWFRQYTLLSVGSIASCQGLIAMSMLLRGRILKLGIFGAIIFFVAIAPLGVGSGFPTTVTLAIAMYVVLRKGSNDYLWKKPAPNVSFIEMVD